MSKLLVVDDEVHVRELMNKVLAREGYVVTTVPTAAQALDILFREVFDLIVLDIQLAQESGMTVLKAIRQKNTKIPVVIYSGCVTPEIETEARASGATEVLRKDIGMDTLAKQITRIVHAKDRIVQGLSIKKEAPILVVDDQENVRGLLRGFFGNKGYQVLEASNGQEAVDVARSHPISAVLLDIEMPVMDGLEALPKLLGINPRMGIVMATGVEDDEKVKQAIALGAYGYVLKPFDFLYLELVVMSRLAISQDG